ncbi:zinc-binding alcohol dehydrogenase family protein [Salinarimonas sp.]|uniref:quinone oxidoreductase family protein n=1 Tax=Salinarimonas sp. TaxID=2766526 RepID=UPI00391B6090
MKAILVKEFGPPDGLALVDLPAPVAGDGQVVVAVEAIGVGLVDVLARRGHLGAAAPGFAPGVEVAGRVETVGTGVDPALIGKRVFALGRGGYAEQFVADRDGVFPLPETVSAEAAMALGVNALVARLSIERARLAAGERVLVRGASGGIGAVAAQMAASSGAIVTATTRAEAAEQVRGMGVQEVIRRDLDPEPEGPFDVVIDPVAGDGMLALIGTLARNGRYVVNGAAAGFPPAGIDQAMLQNFSKSLTYSMVSLDSVAKTELARVAAAVFAEAARGALRPIVAEVLPLRDAARAHRMLETGKRFGKIVLQP